ncbi:MAG TPA: D-2-hydroxyacid dehydrogenase family protein [Marmoricola sp.]|nr:D-2-hydroxyacid dehydrogenase family protein [Marmoricola sp.]
MDIIVLDDYQGVAAELADWSRLRAQGRVEFSRDHVADPDALVRRLEPYDVVVLMRERTALPATVVDRLPRLRLVVTTGRRNPVIDLDACRRRGVVVCNTGSPPGSTVEHTWALLLGLCRHLVEEATNVREGRWQSTLGRDLGGRTLGVLGLGRIGSEVVRVARAFGMDVVAWSRSLTPERAADAGAQAVPFEEVFTRADVVSIHLVLADGTRGLVGERELRLMRPGSLLVNTSRGPIVDTGALVSALADGHLGGAAVDVFDTEPLPADHPMRRTPRLLATPHLGYVTERVYRTFYGEAVEDVEAFLTGSPIRRIDGG